MSPGFAGRDTILRRSVMSPGFAGLDTNPLLLCSKGNGLGRSSEVRLAALLRRFKTYSFPNKNAVHKGRHYLFGSGGRI